MLRDEALEDLPVGRALVDDVGHAGDDPLHGAPHDLAEHAVLVVEVAVDARAR